MGLKRWNKKAQVTIFIIIAIVIVVAGFLIYLFYPQIKSTVSGGDSSPVGYIQDCIQEDFQKTVQTLSLQGGSMLPTNFLLYNDSRIDYLCYTNENAAKLCIVQQPVLQGHIQEELKKELENKIDACFESMKTSYKNRGYDVTLTKGEKTFELEPNKILISIKNSLTLTRGDVQRYDEFVVMLNNNLYELTNHANSIIAWESIYGDAETTAYMTYYPNIKVEKIGRPEGKVYVISDRTTGDKFQFAVRGFIIK
jgi:hypothetical protein